MLICTMSGQRAVVAPLRDLQKRRHSLRDVRSGRAGGLRRRGAAGARIRDKQNRRHDEYDALADAAYGNK
jgi:hypothetical protein